MAEPTQYLQGCDGCGIDGLLGRDTELTLLRTLAAGARDGRAGVAVVQGGAGIGKTSLVDAWVRSERRNGMRVLRSTCAQTSTGFAFSLVRQLFAPVLADADEKERAELLAGPAELAARTLGTDDGSPEAGPVRSDSFALLHGLYWFLIHLAAGGPLVIVVDDAHWCDAPSLRWISYITRRIEGLPVLLVLTERTGEDHPTAAQLTEIATQPDCRPIPLSPLTGPDVAVLVRAATDSDADDAFCRACEQASEGNPLLLVELLRTLVDNRVPPHAEHIGAVEEFRGRVLARTVLHRVGCQAGETVELARALAILGDDTPTRVAAALSGLGASEVARHELVLRRIGVLHDDAPARFRHPLIRTAIIEGTMTPDDLAGGSVRAARILYQEGATSEQVAAHLMNCEPGAGGSWSAEVLQDAARVARHRGAPDAAVRYLQRALSEPLSEYERATVLVELGTDELMLVPKTAVGRLRESLLIIEDPATRGRVSAMLAAALQMARRGPDAVTVLQQAVAGLGDRADKGPQRELLLHLKAQLIQVAYEERSTIELVGPLIESVSPDSLQGDTPGERAVLAASLIHAMAGHESAAHANALADRALRGGINLSGPTEMLFALATLGLITTDRLQEAASWYDQLSEQAVRCGSQRIAIGAAYGKASATSRQGRVVDALMQAQALLERSPDLGYSTLPIAALIVNNLIELGDLGAAGEVLRANRHHDSPDAVWDRGPFLVAQGRWQLVSGDAEAALETLLCCGERQDAAGLVNPAVTAWRSQAALAYAALGRRQEAIQTASEELRLSREWGTARMIGVSMRHLGLVTGGDAGFALLGQAVDHLEDSPASLELAKSLHDFGAAQLSAGDTRTARTTLRRSFDLAEQCGATALSERTRAALLTTGARPRRGQRQEQQPLTASEYQMAGMAATGHTNHQIAQALFVTPGAVATHLASSYRKLGITGRVQLRDALNTARL